MTQKELDIIKNAKFGTSHNDQINADLQRLFEAKTNNFTDPSAISKDKYDMTAHLEKMNKSVSDYVSKFGSVMRSEEDTAKQLIKEIKGEDSGTSAPSGADDTAMLILLAQAAAAAAEAAEAEAEAERKRKKK